MMIEQSLFKKHFVGRDGFIWWIGQIASDSWTKNTVGSGPRSVSVKDHPGFGYRYQVRIMGYHTADDTALKDEDLPWADVMYPVTSGGGGDTTFETPSIRKGNFVYGFFVDGEDAQHPVIMGILGYNQYQPIYYDKTKPFVPFRGFDNTSPVASYGILPLTEENPTRSDVPGKQPSNANITTGASSSAVGNNAAKVTEQDSGLKSKPLKSPYVCDKEKSPGQIQKDIQNMIQNIQKAQKGLKNIKYSITHPIQFEGQQVSIQEYIQIQIDRGTEVVTKWVRNRIAGAQEWITRKINNGLKDVYFLVYPDKQNDLKSGVETAMDLFGCLFKRIMKNLLNIVRKALLTVVDRFINVPLCAAENIIAAILGKLSGLINSAVAAIMKPLEAILGVVDIAGDILGFIEDVLSFLQCEEKPECPEIDSWSLWDGADEPLASFDPTSLINKVKGFAAGVSQAVDPNNFDFDFDFSDIFDNPCNINAILCGPPNVVFWGGSGSGASGNAIVSAAGDILGVDIINSGSGYGNKPTFINFEDSCGKGVGASGRVILGPVSGQPNGFYIPDPNGTEIGIVGVVMDHSGYNYLPVPDGSEGGDRRVWKEPDETIVKREDQTWDVPYGPGDNVVLKPGDKIKTPEGTTGELLTDDGEIIRFDGGKEFTVSVGGILTAPKPKEVLSIRSDSNSYGVILYMCDVIIKNTGFGYQEGDEIVVEPSRGAELKPTFNQIGQLTSVRIISGGEGFKEIPKIYIKTDTGVNAEMSPRFCIDSVDDTTINRPGIDVKVVSVIDCVGKI